MASKKAPPGKRERRENPIVFESFKDEETDAYTDQVGWSTQVGTTLGELPKKEGARYNTTPVFTLCAIMKVPKPKKASLHNIMSALYIPL